MRARRPDLATRGDHGRRNETRHGSSQRGTNVLDETRPCDSQRASSTPQSFIHFLASVAFLLPSEPPCRHSPTRNTYSQPGATQVGKSVHVPYPAHHAWFFYLSLSFFLRFPPFSLLMLLLNHYPVHLSSSLHIPRSDPCMARDSTRRISEPPSRRYTDVPPHIITANFRSELYAVIAT